MCRQGWRMTLTVQAISRALDRAPPDAEKIYGFDARGPCAVAVWVPCTVVADVVRIAEDMVLLRLPQALMLNSRAGPTTPCVYAVVVPSRKLCAPVFIEALGHDQRAIKDESSIPFDRAAALALECATRPWSIDQKSKDCIFCKRRRAFVCREAILVATAVRARTMVSVPYCFECAVGHVTSFASNAAAGARS